MRWLMITQRLDPADDNLGFVMRWVESLAARLDGLDVVCQGTARPALPPNVTAYSLGKESGYGRLRQAIRLTRFLRERVPQVDGVFCHMIPRYVWLAAPWTRLYHKPLLHWYTHRAISLELRLARRCATHILTASSHSYPLPTDKLAVMGHGIETEQFPPADGENSPPEVLMVARLSRIKRQDWLLRAASRVMARPGSPPSRVVIVGGESGQPTGYGAELEALAARLDLPVTFAGSLPYAEIGGMMRGCAVAVNLSPTGLFDKAALQTMLSGKPTLVTNPDFLPVMGDAADLLYLPDGASDDDLADRLARLLAMTPDQRAALGRDLRERVIAQHSLEGLMDRLVALMTEAAGHG